MYMVALSFVPSVSVMNLSQLIAIVMSFDLSQADKIIIVVIIEWDNNFVINKIDNL